MKPITFFAILAAAILTIGILDGAMDTLQFHYSESVFSDWAGDDRNSFWGNPRTDAWTRKFARDAEGQLIRPLQPAFFGSTTFLVFTTDAWHLFKEIKSAVWRTLLVWLIIILLGLVGGTKWFYAPGLWIAAWLVQAGGFHLMYTYVLV